MIMLEILKSPADDALNSELMNSKTAAIAMRMEVMRTFHVIDGYFLLKFGRLSEMRSGRTEAAWDRNPSVDMADAPPVRA
jgi:hypothetical protein